MCSPHKILIDYHSGAGIRWNTLLFKKQTEQKTGEVLWREQRSAWDETNKPIASLSLPEQHLLLIISCSVLLSFSL